jgi:hypothetical protein
MSGETLLPEASPSSRKRSDKKGKGKEKETKSASRGKVFRSERLEGNFDSSLDFVTG